MAIVKKIVRTGEKPTVKMLKEIEKAENSPVIFDDECPELTEDELAKMAEIARARRNAEKKIAVSVRLSPETLAKAKAIGRGYTGFLSRLIDNALNDSEMVEKSL